MTDRSVERAPGPPVFTVSEINAAAAELLTQAFGDIAVEGEISRMTRAASGHWYFDLADEHAWISSVMFRGDNSRVGFAAEVGTLVCARGRLDLYAPRGQYQFVVNRMEEAGAGALSRRFEELKKKLQAEGLFAAERKRPLPPCARRLGVLTSPSGAALQDVLRVLRRRDPGAEVVLYPIPVQGAGADRQIVAALETAGRRDDGCDLLLLVRGGGSAEDLSCFNSEALVRAIAACPLPIVSGIGHEIDFTLADFVADYRAPTPSAAAEVASIDRDELQRGVRQQVERMQYSLDLAVANRAERLQALEKRLQAQRPDRVLARWREQLQALLLRARQTLRREHLRLAGMRNGTLSRVERMQHSLDLAVANRAERLQALEKRLRAQRPDRVLARWREQLQVLLLRARQALRREQLRLAGMRNGTLSFERRLQQAVTWRCGRLRERLERAEASLRLLDQDSVLKRGFAVARDASGHILRDAAKVAVGAPIQVTLERGSLDALVEGRRSGREK